MYECKEIAKGLMIVSTKKIGISVSDRPLNTHSQRCRLSSLISSAGYLAHQICFLSNFLSTSTEHQVATLHL